jgi:para-nitrobenzyl esterase
VRAFAAFLLVAFSLALTACGSSNNAATADGSIVQVAQGSLQGTVGANGRQFLGIPFAAPPVGDLRWKAPQPPAAWTTTRDATKIGNRCPQVSTPLENAASNTEDCLYLNVYTPVPSSSPRPVMVWLHGGTYSIGAGSDYPGDVVAADGNVVVVTVNYRLGPFGFLALPGLADEDANGSTGNYGLLDQLAAMHWVHDNITQFGGDPGNVTLFGESAGAISICGHLASPLSAGLFHKAITESGPCGGALTVKSAEKYGSSFAARSALGCKKSSASAEVSCLRGKSTDEIIAAETPQEQQALSFALGPVIDNYFLTQGPSDAIKSGQYNAVPVLSGSNHDEGKLFVALIYDLFVPPVPLNNSVYDDAVKQTIQQYDPQFSLLSFLIAPLLEAQYPLSAYPAPAGYDPDIAPAHAALSALQTDSAFSCPEVGSNDMFAGTNQPLYAYEFADPNPPRPFSDNDIPPPLAGHAAELVYVFQAPLEGGALNPDQFTPDQLALSTQMLSYWTNFATTGNPNGAGLPQWPQYTSGSPQILTLAPGTSGITTTTSSAFKTDHNCSFWSLLGG